MEHNNEPAATRRAFLDQALAAASAVALAEVLPVSSSAQSGGAGAPSRAPAAVPVPGSVNLRKIGEITSTGDKLQAVISVKSRMQTVPDGAGGSTTAMMRYYDGHRPDRTQQWPPTFTGGPAPANPGPTLRCKLGDKVQIAFINAVHTSEFQGTLDRVDRGGSGTILGCDASRSAGVPTGQTPTPAPTPGPGGHTPYPTVYPANDTFPDCLHGSSSANIHFHGTHVTPSTTGDNVLITVRPDPNVSEADVLAMFAPLWHDCDLGRQPHVWKDLPPRYRAEQERLLRNYDRTAPYLGKNGNLPRDQWLWPQNQEAIDAGEWPQWYMGAFPYCYQIPQPVQDRKPVNFQMGQAPGTHWYHSHKHGSTAINMFNGMSGAMIIEDPSPNGYDRKLRAFYGFDASHKPKLDELVLVFQQLIGTPNLFTNTGVTGRAPTLTNGQFAPTITMRPGQVQLWRMINACVANDVPLQFQPVTGTGPVLPTMAPSPTPPPPPNRGLTYKQTAQDGVQFAWRTFHDQDTVANPVLLAPANRADLLVQAPSTPGMYVMQASIPHYGGPVLFVNVIGPAVPAMGFPSKESDWPHRATWLNNIAPSAKNRNIVYGWKLNPGGILRTLPDKGAPSNGGILPLFTINGRQFSEGHVDETMHLGDTEQWIIANATTVIAHPFHIHINPFQIYELFDPATMTAPLTLTGPLVWWDTFAIPAGIITTADTTDPRTGKIVAKGDILPGYFKMRTRFVDFTGFYVEHCHILMHEDRGMMQLLEVVDPRVGKKRRYMPRHH